MLEKPDLADEKIIDCLRKKFAVDASTVEFLSQGNDSSAWVYRVQTGSSENFFLKVRKGRVTRPALTIPHFLQNQGIRQVVAPLPARSGRLWKRLGSYVLILYPYIQGSTGMETGLTAGQWTEFGQTLRQIHAAALPPELARQMRRENFRPYWSATVRRLDQTVNENAYQHPVERELARFWKSKNAQIRKIVDRANELGRMLQKTKDPDQFILCHADIHTANLLIDPGGALHIVDWDQALFAPKERDLMFFVGTAGESVTVASQEQGWFFSGYGKTEVDPLALAYYQYEWVVQEIGDYGERVFLMPELGEETKKTAVAGFQGLFAPGDVVDSAYRAEQEL